MKKNNPTGKPSPEFLILGCPPNIEILPSPKGEGKCAAFTLAEVLITLVIIGIIAAVTLPMVNQNTQNKEFNTARLKARASIGEAFRTMSTNGVISADITTKDFVEKIIPKYLKLDKTCATARECGFPEKIKRPDGVEVDVQTTWMGETDNRAYGIEVPAVTPTDPSTTATGTYNTNTKTKETHNNSYFFTTLDGFHVNFFYNPYCVSTGKEKPYVLNSSNYSYTNIYPQFSLDVTCFNAVYDMNGTKGPNQVGKDIGFVGSVYNGYQTQSAAVLPGKDEFATASLPNLEGDKHWEAASNYCMNLGGNNEWILPDINELTLIFLNKKLVTTNSSNWFWSRSVLPLSGSNVRRVSFGTGYRYWLPRTNSGHWVRCVRRDKT